MLNKDKEIVKLYYQMNEVAAMFNANQSQIRFWENEFDLLQPKLSKKGNRQFTQQDIEVYKIIFKLKEEGYSVKGIKKYLEENAKNILHKIKTGETKQSKLEIKLRKIRASLVELGEKL